MAYPSLADRPRRTPRWRWPLLAIVVVAVVVVAYTVDAYDVGRSGGPAGPTSIDILPSGGTGSSCITGHPGVPRPTLPLRYGVFQANTYDVPSGTTGSVGMCYQAANGSLIADANWSHVGSAGGWFSYPQVTYGVNFWDGALSSYTNQSPAWALPQTVAAVTSEDVWFTTNYTYHAPPAANVTGYDLSLDDFLTETLPPEFEAGPFVEVEVFLAHQIAYPFEWVHWSAPTLVGSQVSVEPWDVGYWCHGTDNGTNANVSFDFSYGGQSTNGLEAGVLGVNLSAILGEVVALMPGVTCWSGPTSGFAGFYLDEANLGSEAGAVGNTSVRYSWTVPQYCIHPYVADQLASSVSCSRG